MPGARNTDESMKKQKPSRAKGSKKNKKRWCGGKVGKEHDYIIGVPSWANSGPYKEWHCEPWHTVTGTRWFCRHIDICTKCGRNEPRDPKLCPDFPPNQVIGDHYEEQN